MAPSELHRCPERFAVIGAQIKAIERAREQRLKAPPRVGKGTSSGRAQTKGPKRARFALRYHPTMLDAGRATRAL